MFMDDHDHGTDERNAGSKEKQESSTLKHNTHETNGVKQGLAVTQHELINQLNLINFQNQPILVNFKHPKYQRTITLKAVPQPCFNQDLVCLWEQTIQIEAIKRYQFQDFFIANGLKLISVKPEVKRINTEGVFFSLPEKGFEKNRRKNERYTCRDLTVQLIQNSIFYTGNLLDFNSENLHISLSVTPPNRFQWINPKSMVSIVVSKKDHAIYSGECRIIKQSAGKTNRKFLLEPLRHVVPRFSPKEYRSKRLTLYPSPDLYFKHPFTDKLVNLKVIDLSGSGFSVKDTDNKMALLAGMIIPDAEINIAGALNIKCLVQVVYRNPLKRGETHDQVQFGLTFLDMDFEHHQRLMALLDQTEDKNSSISSKIDPDTLWKFFFETGFIYPEKYSFLHFKKKEIKETFERLYTMNPGISRHFVYQESGVIAGHMAMLRFYNNTWLIHHYAVRKPLAHRIGLIVLNRIIQFTFDSHRLHSSHMDYLMSYFQSEKAFYTHVFGNAVKKINNPKACSSDQFGYFHFRKGRSDMGVELPAGWTLNQPASEDLRDLESFYEQVSGGLMLQALNLETDSILTNDISIEYGKLGFKREHHVFALKKQEALIAIIIVNISDIALNLSDLTNCVQMIVLEPEGLSESMLSILFERLSSYFEQRSFPILIFPDSFADAISITYERRYTLWIMNMQNSDDYFKHLEQLKSHQKKE